MQAGASLLVGRAVSIVELCFAGEKDAALILGMDHSKAVCLWSPEGLNDSGCCTLDAPNTLGGEAATVDDPVEAGSSGTCGKHTH